MIQKNLWILIPLTMLFLSSCSSLQSALENGKTSKGPCGSDRILVCETRGGYRECYCARQRW
jgi:hypothetical protein